MTERPDYEAFAARVDARRRALGLSYPEVARRMGLKNEQYVRDVVRGLKEPGKGFIPKPPRDRALAAALECSFDYLLGLTDDESVDAADLVPDTQDERAVLATMKGLSSSEQRRLRTIVELSQPTKGDAVLVTGPHGEMLYRGPERRGGNGLDRDYKGSERRREHVTIQASGGEGHPGEP